MIGNPCQWPMPSKESPWLVSPKQKQNWFKPKPKVFAVPCPTAQVHQERSSDPMSLTWLTCSRTTRLHMLRATPGTTNNGSQGTRPLTTPISVFSWVIIQIIWGLGQLHLERFPHFDATRPVENFGFHITSVGWQIPRRPLVCDIEQVFKNKYHSYCVGDCRRI